MFAVAEINNNAHGFIELATGKTSHIKEDRSGLHYHLPGIPVCP